MGLNVFEGNFFLPLFLVIDFQRFSFTSQKHEKFNLRMLDRAYKLSVLPAALFLAILCLIFLETVRLKEIVTEIVSGANIWVKMDPRGWF